MTNVPANKIPVSVDYTGRDYYALREELIARVKEATNQQWQGNDPADFGLALIEAFAYMGDQVNYYIDRIANESYLLTATQRQSLLNIAQTYGYTPTGYVGSVVDATFTCNIGSRNQVGASILTTVDISGATPHVACLAVPTNHPFAVGDTVIVRDMQQTAYNGVYQVIKIGIDSNGRNVIYYQPHSSISTISGNGTKVTVTTTGAHQFAVGQSIVISGVSPSGYNGTYTITDVTSTTFKFASSTTTAYVSGGDVYYADIATAGDGTLILGYAYTVGSITVPAGTQLTAQVTYEDKTEQVMFTTLSNATLGYLGNPNSTAVVQARQGENVAYRAKNLKNTSVIPYDINGELLGYSTGEAEQSLVLSETKVDKSFLEVYVDSGSNFDKWQQVQHLTDFGPNAAVYTVTLMADNTVRVTFGDGVSGAIPPKDAAIKAVYYAGGGPIGNIEVGLLSTITAVPTASTPTAEALIKSSVSVTNTTVGSGGSDPETNDVIRFNAPRTLSALNRAVTLDDFANLALSLRGVGKAKATAETRTSVTVYVAPSQADTATEVTPGVDPATGQETISMAALRSSVADFITDKKQIGTTVTVGYPTYVPVVLTVEYTALPQYTAAQVESYIKSALFAKFAYNYVDFGDVITPEEVEFKLRQVTGVRNIRVTEFYRQGGSGRSSMVGADNEIFIFLDNNVTLTAAPTDATLSSLVVGSGGTINQSFNPNVTEYVVTVNTGVSTVNLTPTLTDSAAHLTVNNSVVSSGAVQTIATPVGNSVTVVSVTAGDGVTVRNYKVTFSRAS